jgi:Flp pilus assembly pilin Flp
MLAAHVFLSFSFSFCRACSSALSRARRPGDQRGQTSAEYALVLLGAAAIALLIVSWATRTNLVGRLLDAVFEQLLRRVR